jgi:probable F420-dependent oxidoreductase
MSIDSDNIGREEILMQLGAVFPQSEIGNDPGAIAGFAQAVEELGFTHLLVYDHVLGADPDRPGGWRGPYDKDTPFHEPFVLFGYLAGLTRRIELVTTVLILPQRQAALVAKQAAAVDVLCGGRLRLGVGTGWNQVEYQALGVPFEKRGARQEEQIALMRALWKDDAISFDGRFHKVTKAGINPRPARGSIPIWFGGGADALLDRAARIGDGWMPLGGANDQSRKSLERIREGLAAHGRDASRFGVQAQAQIRGGDPERWRNHADAWRTLGATHLAIASMNAGLRSPDDHVEAMRRWKSAVS